MIELQHKNSFFLLAEESYQQRNYRQFFSAEFWQEQGRILGSAQGRGVTWFIQTKDWFGVNVALRHYYRGGLWGKIIKDHYYFNGLTQTRSFAEFYLLQKLWLAGVPVPKPIAAKIEKKGLYYQADILTEKIENAQDLTAVLQQQILPTRIWQQIGGVIRQLHNLQICHTDLNCHNILLQQIENQEKCWLLDFDKCSEKSGDSWKTENLQRLQRSFYKEVGRMGIQFQLQNWRDLLQGYHQPSFEK